MGDPSSFETLSDGLHAIDTGFHRPKFDAAYLVVDSGRAAFIDTGTNHSVPRLLATLEHLGLPRSAVDWVIPTHVHLDHAGGCGLLMQHLPQARLLVHPRGARHLQDPSALFDSALSVYGSAEMERSYGRLVPVPATRLVHSHDGMQVMVGHRQLEVMDTPGHARHHHCIWDQRTQGWFTGDTFGLSYREFDVDARQWAIPSTTPVGFEPAELKASITRLVNRKPQRMYLTHYGAVEQVQAIADDLLRTLDRMVEIALAVPADAHQHGKLKQRLFDLYLACVRQHGCDWPDTAIHSILAMDLELNAQGLEVWLRRRAKQVPR